MALGLLFILHRANGRNRRFVRCPFLACSEE